LYNENPEMFLFFVPGAPVMITENINVKKGIFNGAEGTMHSIRWAEKDADHEELLATIQVSLVDGQIYYHPTMPYCVNIQMALVANVTTGLPSTPATADLSYVVIPLTRAYSWTSFKPAMKIPVSTSKDTFSVKSFKLELSFAVTYHKVQGKTLDKVVLDIGGTTHNKVTVAMAYVGFSRVRFNANIRVLPTAAPILKKLNEAQFSSDLVAWYRTQHPLPPAAAVATAPATASTKNRKAISTPAHSAAAKKKAIATPSQNQTPPPQALCAHGSSSKPVNRRIAFASPVVSQAVAHQTSRKPGTSASAPTSRP
jgi:hypothetical protein